MKNAEKSAKTDRNFDEVISRLSENEVLNLQAMSCVKGGNDEGNGTVPIIITKF